MTYERINFKRTRKIRNYIIDKQDDLVLAIYSPAQANDKICTSSNETITGISVFQSCAQLIMTTDNDIFFEEENPNCGNLAATCGTISLKHMKYFSDDDTHHLHDI